MTVLLNVNFSRLFDADMCMIFTRDSDIYSLYIQHQVKKSIIEISAVILEYTFLHNDTNQD